MIIGYVCMVGLCIDSIQLLSQSHSTSSIPQNRKKKYRQNDGVLLQVELFFYIIIRSRSLNEWVVFRHMTLFFFLVYTKLHRILQPRTTRILRDFHHQKIYVSVFLYYFLLLFYERNILRLSHGYSSYMIVLIGGSMFLYLFR